MTLIEARRRADLTQDELAEKSGVDQTTISSLETGRREPQFSTVLRLAKALGVQADELRFGADRMSA